MSFKRKITIFLLLLATIVYLPLDVAAANDPGKDLTKLLGQLQTMQSQFQQTIYDGNGGVIQRSTGSMALQRPGKFRWDIKTPNPQLIVADGKKIWVYDPDLEQVTVQPMGSTMEGTPAFLLTGSTDNIVSSFKITETQEAKTNLTWFTLTPKDPSSLFQSVKLAFNGNQLIKMSVQDNLNQQTMIFFSQVKINQTLNSSLFSFTPPKGVDVVAQ